MIEAHLYRDGHATGEHVGPERIPDLLAQDDVFLWLDVRTPDDEDFRFLQETFGLHPLVVEDLRHQHQRPKVELYEGQASVVLRPVRPAAGIVLEELELHALAARRYLITI